ncbi:toprim domain-containing protein, partial [Klebsiella pneumoniae]|nr:toprim domain-containing protein [Klebsiella pneumoniae]
TGGSSKTTEKKPVTRAKLTDAQKAEKAQTALVNRMGVDPEHDWKAQYEVLPGKEHVVAELKKLAKDADEIYLATDL